MAWRTFHPARPRRATLLALIGIGTATLIVIQQPGLSASRTLPSLHLEELTWTEVHQALLDDYDTVIVPTGGTEQNGPHAVLGKHNYIVRDTSGQIAARLGGTLIAPVMAYVPEGDSGDAPSGHMSWAGTLSLPEPVFEAVLEQTARSLATHGFTRILFIGDSLGNQNAQARVAERLTAEWMGKGIRVIHLGDYYAANGQIEALEKQGFSRVEIGNHAGIRDTSELMAVYPEGVRRQPVAPPRGAMPGADGAPDLATVEIGRDMLQRKVEAALHQLRLLDAAN